MPRRQPERVHAGITPADDVDHSQGPPARPAEQRFVTSTSRWLVRQNSGSSDSPSFSRTRHVTASVRPVGHSRKRNKGCATELGCRWRSSIAAMRRSPAHCATRRQTRRRVSIQAQPPEGIWRDLRRRECSRRRWPAPSRPARSRRLTRAPTAFERRTHAWARQHP